MRWVLVNFIIMFFNNISEEILNFNLVSLNLLLYNLDKVLIGFCSYYRMICINNSVVR